MNRSNAATCTHHSLETCPCCGARCQSCAECSPAPYSIRMLGVSGSADIEGWAKDLSPRPISALAGFFSGCVLAGGLLSACTSGPVLLIGSLTGGVLLSAWTMRSYRGRPSLSLLRRMEGLQARRTRYERMYLCLDCLQVHERGSTQTQPWHEAIHLSSCPTPAQA